MKEWTFKGSDELRRALKDGPLRRGLERLHRVKRLTELEAPQQIISGSSESLTKSIAELGDRWSEAEDLYAEYRVWEKASSDFAEAWENRCQHCAYSLEADYDDDDLESWCQKYTVSSRVMPKICPDFTDERN